MNYEKKYKEALERARELSQTTTGARYEYIFPELRESEDEKIRKWIIDDIRYNINNEPLNNSEYKKKVEKAIAWLKKQGEKPQGKSALEAAKEKKVDNQNCVKPANKIEPKFKVGYWVVNKCGNVWHIDSFDSKNYQVSNGDKYCYLPIEKQNEMHLWCIRDAKDGDILFHSDSASNGIFIFKELLKYEFGEKIICYCDYDSEDHFCLGENHTCCWADAKILQPATKEQRDTLMKAMADAGYSFDFNKKELKKIEYEFHEGDWIIYNNDICQIVKLEEGYNKLVTNFGIEKEPVNERNLSTARIWTIEDAKNGDILYSPTHRLIWIYKDKYQYHAAVNFNYTDLMSVNGVIFIPSDVYPANKKQRDILFQKIKEHGYYWVASKKELNTIKGEINYDTV